MHSDMPTVQGLQPLKYAFTQFAQSANVVAFRVEEWGFSPTNSHAEKSGL
jgi:hypothetical protein